MGILDMLTSVMAQRAAADLDRTRVAEVFDEIIGQNGRGGVAALVNLLRQAGLGAQIDSWLGDGERQQVSAQQVQDALGGDLARRLANGLGLPSDQLPHVLALLLPEAINRASSAGGLHNAF